MQSPLRECRGFLGASDKYASHATRLDGTENWKAKNLPNPPTVTIFESHPGRIVTPAQLEELHRTRTDRIGRTPTPPPCFPPTGLRAALAGL